MVLNVLILVTFAAILHASWNFAARKVSGDLTVVWIGLCLGALCGAPFAWRLADASVYRALPYMAATGGVNALYFLALARAYETGEISQVYPLTRGSAVAATAVAAHFIFSEPVYASSGLGIAAVCFGIMLIGWPPGLAFRRQAAVVYALVAGATVMVSYLIDKAAMGFAEPVVYIFGLCSFAALALAPYVWISLRAECAEAWRYSKKYAVIIGIGSMYGYLLILYALKLGPVSLIVPFREMGVVFGSFLGVFLLKERLTTRKTLGIAAIAAGLILIKLAPH